MRITVNGHDRELDLGSEPTLEVLLRTVAPPGVPCAVELNRRVVPAARCSETRLRDGDRVEIVTLVGGG